MVRIRRGVHRIVVHTASILNPLWGQLLLRGSLWAVRKNGLNHRRFLPDVFPVEVTAPRTAPARAKPQTAKGRSPTDRKINPRSRNTKRRYTPVLIREVGSGIPPRLAFIPPKKQAAKLIPHARYSMVFIGKIPAVSSAAKRQHKRNADTNITAPPDRTSSIFSFIFTEKTPFA